MCGSQIRPYADVLQRAITLSKAEYAKAEAIMADRDQGDHVNGVTGERSHLGPAKGPDVKIFEGMTYEVKTTGPFAGKLVGNQKRVVSIDGEDFVLFQGLMRTTY